MVFHLRSVQLARHPRPLSSTGVSLDTEKLRQTVQTAVHMRDAGSDLHCYTTSETRRCNLYLRPIGLGSTGWQDARYAMKMSYAVTYAVEFTDQSRAIIAYGANRSASSSVADRSSTMDGSLLCRQVQKGKGNADVTAITPTAASADICSISPPIESALCAECTGLNACLGAALRVRDLGIPIMRREGKARDSSLGALGDLYRLA